MNLNELCSICEPTYSKGTAMPTLSAADEKRTWNMSAWHLARGGAGRGWVPRDVLSEVGTFSGGCGGGKDAALGRGRS